MTAGTRSEPDAPRLVIEKYLRGRRVRHVHQHPPDVRDVGVGQRGGADVGVVVSDGVPGWQRKFEPARDKSQPTTVADLVEVLLDLREAVADGSARRRSESEELAALRRDIAAVRRVLGTAAAQLEEASV